MRGDNAPSYKRLQRLLCRPCNYTVSAQKAFTGLYSGLTNCLPCFFCACYPAVHPAMSHYQRHAGAHHSAVAPPAYTRYQPPRRTLYRLAQLPYYNKVYKGAAVRPCYGFMPDGAAYRRPCQPGGGLDASHARRLAIWHRSTVKAHQLAPSTRRGSPAAGARRGGAEPLTATAVSIFGLSPDS